MADHETANSKVIQRENSSPRSPDVAEMSTEKSVIGSAGVADETYMYETKAKVACVDANALSITERPCINWAIGSENNSEEENEVPMTENASRKNFDPPVLDRKSIEDATSCTSDSTAELDVLPITKKPRPRPIDTLTEGNTTPVKRNSLHVNGWESDDSDARHRSDSNASSQPLLSSKHAPSTERMLAATTAEVKSKIQDKNLATNENSANNQVGERDGADTASTSTTLPLKANGAVSVATDVVQALDDEVH